jgi:L-threonylcarbamoyladenylate synthase
MSELATHTSIEAAAAAIRAGQPVVLPTDTVYGLCAAPYRAEPVRELYKLKGRGEEQPTALVAASFELLLECVPELRGRAATLARELLPGPYTLILPNSARRFRWLTGTRPDTIGVRVPELDGPGRAVLHDVGAVAATSANTPGGPDPVTVADVPEELRAGCGAIVDGGTLPGIASTVLDLTGSEPRVLREGAGPVDEAFAKIEPLLA